MTIPRPTAMYDTECYPNFWLLKLKPRGCPTHSYRLKAGESFSAAQIAEITQLFRRYTVVSFNGLGYDVPMITGALSGYTPEQLKVLNDSIIVEKLRPWQLGLREWQPDDHIDVMEVAPGAGSQKQYAGRIHCKKMQDLPYDPSHTLTEAEMLEVERYCENDLAVLEELYVALRPQLQQRETLSKRYGIDLRSKSDAQVAEAVLKLRCGCRGKAEVDWNMQFMYCVPPYIGYQLPQLQAALGLVSNAVFRLSAKGQVEMPQALEKLDIIIGQSVYKVGIGGLHSQEKCVSHVSDDQCVLQDWDVASYYPSLILNSGEWPKALGQQFLTEYEAIKDERLAAKTLQANLKKAGDTSSAEYLDAEANNEGGKVAINGCYGKMGSPYSVLFAPTMLIQTTMTGQLSLLMLIEWHEHYGIPVVSANTDGIIIKCPRPLVATSQFIIAEWEKRTGLTMEHTEYRSVHSRDINSYFAVKTDGSVKRKGEYSKAGLVEKKNPDVEICSDAVAEYLANGTPLEVTVFDCLDIRKFVTIQKVAGGGVKMWGAGPVKGARVREMIPVLEANGWMKCGRKWVKAIGNYEVSGGNDWNEYELSATEAYALCFAPQHPEYLGKVVRWYYSTQAPGSIVYASNGNTVGLSEGSMPCMTLPDEFPTDIDYEWYLNKCRDILVDIGYPLGNT